MNYKGDIYSITNQEILRKFVNNEVIMCGSDIVGFILEQENSEAPFTYDDIANAWREVCPECSCDLEEIYEDDIVVNHKWICESCGETFDTKEEAMNCCYADEEDREGLDESDMVNEVWVCPFCEDTYATEEEAKDCICHWKKDMYRCTCCGKYVTEDDVDEEQNEAYEWWFVSNWLAEKLDQHHEMIIRGWHNVWGRGCSGQSIALDGVIAEIASELGILEGQEHDWSKLD